MRKTKHKIPNKNGGITLIALIITIIVMLILVSVTISMAINGGLFEKAGEAVGDTQNALNKEQELANGKIKIGNTIYNSINEYVNDGKEIDKLQINYEVEDIDARGKAVKLSYKGVDVSIKYLERLWATYMTGQDGAEMDQETRETLMQAAKDAEMDYYDFLKFILEFFDIEVKTIDTVDVIQEGKKISAIKDEFIVSKNGTYTVKVLAVDGQRAEIQIEIKGIVEEKFSSIYEETKTYRDENEKIAKIPSGFAVGISEGINTIDGGLVITDAVDENGYSIGNEYIWIPIGSNEEDFKRESFGDDILDSSYQEPFIKAWSGSLMDPTWHYGYDNEVAEYNEMKKQVLEHQGFYISRYEAGVNSLDFRTTTTGAQDIVIKKGVVPYNYVKWGENTGNIGTEGAVYIAQNMYSGKMQGNSVTSTLIYGVQWDEVCRFIKDYDRVSVKAETINVTGRTGEDNSKNIYDLAGNCKEWTMEGRVAIRVSRGGWKDVAFPISYRDSCQTHSAYDYIGFRVTLYIRDIV